MVLVALLAAFVVTPVASAVAYADASRLELPARERLAWTLAVGAGSFSGFLFPHRFEDALGRAYLHGVKSAPVVTSPYEILALHLSVGVAVSTASVLLYAVAVRRGRDEGGPAVN